MKKFQLPDLGEGLAEVEIVKWYVKVGDTVTLDQPLVSVETAKAVVDIPSPWAGKIEALFGEPKQMVKTGAPLVGFEGEEIAPTVGSNAATVVGKLEEGVKVLPKQSAMMQTKTESGAPGVTPVVRALAKQLEVDLATVTPTGPNGTITMDDVRIAQQNMSMAGTLEPLKGVRKSMAESMTRSHAEVVPVSVYEDADITPWAQEGDATVRMLQAIVFASSKEPALNVWYDSKLHARRWVKGVHVGLAMDTPEGLFVPVIHDVDAKNAETLRKEIENFKDIVVNRKITPDKMRGHTITFSNFGKFAGRYANAVVVPPAVAIIAAGRVREGIAWTNEGPVRRWMLPLALTFDHRVVTGGEATRFLRALISHLRLPEVKEKTEAPT